MNYNKKEQLKYDDFKSKVHKINKTIFSNYNYFDKNEVSLNNKIAHPSFIGLNFKNNIIILNINPGNLTSGHNIASNSSLLTTPEPNLKLGRKLEKVERTWNNFYHKPYLLFDPNIRLFWSSSESYIDLLKKHINDISYNPLIDELFENEKKKTGPLLIYAELFYQHDVKQRNIIDHLNKNINKEDLNKKIKQIINLYCDYYNPRIIIVTNAYASRLIHEALTGEKNINIDEFYYEEKNVLILYSSMITGQRALDNGSYYRLKRRINHLIKEIMLNKQ